MKNYLYLFLSILIISTSCQQNVEEKKEDPIEKYVKTFTQKQISFTPLSYEMTGYTDITNHRNFGFFKAETSLKLKIRAAVRAKFNIDAIKIDKKGDGIEYTLPNAEIEVPNILEYKYLAYKKNLLSPKITRAEMMDAIYSIDKARGEFLIKAKNAKIDVNATNHLKDFLIANAASFGIDPNKISFN